MSHRWRLDYFRDCDYRSSVLDSSPPRMRTPDSFLIPSNLTKSVSMITEVADELSHHTPLWQTINNSSSDSDVSDAVEMASRLGNQEVLVAVNSAVFVISPNLDAPDTEEGDGFSEESADEEAKIRNCFDPDEVKPKLRRILSLIENEHLLVR